MTLEEADPVTEVWPDNIQAINVFISMSTQWRTGMNGATGLDYSALPVVMRLVGVRQADRLSLFSDLRILEDEALATLRESNK